MRTGTARPPCPPSCSVTRGSPHLTSMTRLCPGFLLGSLGLGWLSDRIGRKRNLMVTLAGLLATNLVSATTPHYSVYLVSRCDKEAEAPEFWSSW